MAFFFFFLFFFFFFAHGPTGVEVWSMGDVLGEGNMNDYEG